MSSFLFRQIDTCEGCGDCLNNALPDYFASVVGIKRVGGAPPLPVWVEPSAGAFDELHAARPSGTNNSVYRTLEITQVSPNDSGGTTTLYNKYIFHPVMGDYYWGIETRTSVPARGDDYTYEWKLSDSTSSGVPQVTINDPDATGFTHRPALHGISFGGGLPGVVVDTYTFDTLAIHDDTDSCTWHLSDGYTMQSGLTDVSNSAQSACDEIDIASDNVVIAYDAATGLRNATSNLTDSVASPRSVDAVRVAARRDDGVIMITLPIGDADPAARDDFGAIVVRYATHGNVCSTSCNMAETVDGHNACDDFMWSWMASKMKFAWKTEAWCYKSWKLQTTPFTFPYSLSGGVCCGCDPAGTPGTIYDTVDLKWVIYAYVDTTTVAAGDPCAQPLDFVVQAALVDCNSFGHGDGNVVADVGDLPQPCTGDTQPCVGDVWYYDYTACPLLGFIAPDGSNCGANCNCGITTRYVTPQLLVPPGFL